MFIATTFFSNLLITGLGPCYIYTRGLMHKRTLTLYSVAIGNLVGIWPTQRYASTLFCVEPFQYLRQLFLDLSAFTWESHYVLGLPIVLV